MRPRRTIPRFRVRDRLIDLETHQQVFSWVLRVVAEKGLLKGKTIGIDATTLEAAHRWEQTAQFVDNC
jgi:hypothetical protein